MLQFTGSNLSSRWVFRIWWWLDLLLKWFPNNSFKDTDIGIWIHLVFESLCGFPLPFARTTFSKGSEIKVYTEFQMLSTIVTILWCLNMSQDELLLEKSKCLCYMLVCIFFRAHSKTLIKITEKKGGGGQKCKCGVWQVPKAQGSRHLSFLSKIQKFQEAKEKKNYQVAPFLHPELDSAWVISCQLWSPDTKPTNKIIHQNCWSSCR